MLKKILFAFFIVFVCSSLSFSKNLKVGINTGVYTPSNGQSSVMYGIYADYAIDKSLSLRAEADTTTYTDSNNVQQTYTPISLLAMYVFDGFKLVYPYVNGGPILSILKNSQSTAQTLGARVGCGIMNKVGPFSIGFDLSYFAYDINNLSQGTTTYNVSGVGNIAVDI